MGDEDPEQRLRAIALKVRRFLEPRWWCWRLAKGLPETGHLSQGVCDCSSLFLAAVLAEEGLEARFVIGAPVRGPYGFFTDGSWRGHAWAECAGFVIDLTADQFGGPDLRICPIGDPRYRGGEDLAEPELALGREAAVRRLLARWHAAGGMAAPEAPPAPLTQEDLERLCDD